MVDDRFEPSPSALRMEIRTGVGERRKFSAEDKGRIVVESFLPGAIVSGVARHHGMSPQHLFRWRHDAKVGRLVLPAEDTAVFAPVVVNPAPVGDLPRGPLSAKIEIEVARTVVRVSPGVNFRFLLEVVRALRASV